MKQLDLCGQWQLRGGRFDEVGATVPGCVHTDLLKAGLIPDPYYRDNEQKLMWIGKTDWEYSRTFRITPDILAEQKVLLRCDGLDTFASIRINGKEVARTDNMFRTWEFDVKGFLNVGENAISILFESTYPYMEQRNRERWLWLTGIGQHRIEGSNWVRKMQCNYGWDWGPMCVTCGIWRSIGIVAFSSARLEDVMIAQKHCKKSVDLQIDVKLQRISSGTVDLRADVMFEGVSVASAGASTDGTAVRFSLSIQEPRLWWPNNMGRQDLYEVVVTMECKNDTEDVIKKKIGLRTLRLDRHPDEWGESFQFVVNGVPFFAKGANWIPADTFVTRASDGFYDQLIRDAAAANMNFLRVWGGGIYENDIFYDLCDKYGICVWQDFMFACAAYPAFDNEFMKNVKQEAIDNIKRLRHHSCLALWCGNNEIEQLPGCVNADGSDGAMTWDEYSSLFDKLLPDVVNEYAPGMDYWPSSPHNPDAETRNMSNPSSGDAHLWEVWHGRKPFEWYRTCEHRFNSEFGFESFPEPGVVESFTLPEDRNVSSYIMELHQRSIIGNDAIIQYMLSWFKLPASFNMILRLSQILQGLAMKYAVEHWRRSMPRGMGTLYWQLNDCWPVASWSSIDYAGNWKALHYMARKFFNPILVSCVEDTTACTAEIHLTNDTPREISGDITWQLFNPAGDVLKEGRFEAGTGANQTHAVKTLDFSDVLKEYSVRELLLYLSFSQGEEVVSDNISLLARPKHIELRRPVFDFRLIQLSEKRFSLILSADVPALWVWIEAAGLPAGYSDQYFHLRPGEAKTVEIDVQAAITPEELKGKLVIYSLKDTFQ